MNKRLLLILPLFIALSAYSSDKQEIDKKKDAALSFEDRMKAAKTAYGELTKNSTSGAARTKALEKHRSLVDLMKSNLVYGADLVDQEKALTSQSTPTATPDPAQSEKQKKIAAERDRIDQEILSIADYLLCNRIRGERYSVDEQAILVHLKMRLPGKTWQDRSVA